ncbi:MAG: DUF4142 domain-containing protein [Planctomycetaceae bacterium]|nr:DUF4142 domain-containing protein [Planctomycetaceae bacterium]
MNLRKALSCLSFAVAVTGVSLVSAQQPAQPKPAQPGVQVQVQPGGVRTTAQPGQPGQRAGWQSNDQTFATCLTIDNQEEIAIAKFAESKTDNKDVKEFASMLVTDHEAFIKKLEKFAPEASRNNSLNSDQPQTSEKTERTTTSTNSAVQPAGGAAPAQPGRTIQQTAGTQPQQGQIDFVQLHREMAAQCLADSKKRLSEKSGDEFAQCFVGFQIAKHAAMNTKLTVLQRHASPELKEILASASETVKEHQAHAEKLMDKLASADQKSDSKAKDRKSDKSE